jgi:hypothetical protein
MTIGQETSVNLAKTKQRAFGCIVLAALVAGCSGGGIQQEQLTGLASASIGNASVPQSLGTSQEAQLSAQQLPKASGTPAARPSGAVSVTGVRAATIVLYRSEAGHDGQRVLAGALPFPLQARAVTPTASRVEIETVDGSRWIDKADLVLAAGGPPARVSLN